MTSRGMICYCDSVSENELEAINLYWEMNEATNSGFSFTVSELQAKFKGKVSNLNNLIKKKSCFTFDPDSSACNWCGKITIAYKRKDVLDIKKSDVYVCKTCIHEKQERERLEEEQRKRALFSTIKNIKQQMLLGNYSVSTLSYVEKLYLFLLLSEYYEADGEPLKIDVENFCLAGSSESDHQYISQLVQKNILISIKEIPDEIRVLTDKLVFEGPNAFSRHDWMGTARRSENYLISSPFKVGVYLCQCEKGGSTSSLLQTLYTDICEINLTQRDFEDISILVESVRLGNLYDIVDWISADCRIPVEKSIKLENLLKHLAKSYPLRVCCWLLYSQADKVAAHLHKTNTPSYISKKLLAKKTDDYLTLAKEKGWEFSYTKKLPDDIETSALESLVADHFLEGNFNWQMLTTSEVIKGWTKNAKLVDVNTLTN